VSPDVLTLRGKNVQVLSAGWVRDRFRPGATQLIDQQELDRILIRNGHPGRTTRVIEYIVRGSGEVEFEYSSAKGGTARKHVMVP
jgi:hypothetical protein